MTSTDETRRLYVAWQDPETRRRLPVGVLVQSMRPDRSTRFQFAYLKQAERLERFQPFTSFPDLHRRYESTALFPLFSNRVMPRERPDYDAFVDRLDLSVDADPFEVLARSGGRKATDRVEVFPEPELDTETGQYRCRFFARGIRHQEGAQEAVSALQPGDRLTLVHEPTNEVNDRAFLLHDATGTKLGYVPDYLVAFLHDTIDLCDTAPTVSVEHVNPRDVPSHMRLLCAVHTCNPIGYRPFAEPEFATLVSVG